VNILVTGSSGWLAQTLIPRLQRDGHEVTGIDPKPSPLTGIVGTIADRGLVAAAIRRHGISSIAARCTSPTSSPMPIRISSMSM